jgi:anti-sigma B factor antagonist
MEISERKVGQVTVIGIKGDANISARLSEFQELVRERISAGDRQIVVNLSECTWIDSSGLGELIKALIHAMRQGGALKLTNVPHKVRGLLSVTNLTQVFEIFEDEQAAINSF